MSSRDLPEWLGASGFVPSPDDLDWEELGRALDVPANFASVLDLATRVVSTSDPWVDRIAPVRLTEAQRAQLRG